MVFQEAGKQACMARHGMDEDLEMQRVGAGGGGEYSWPAQPTRTLDVMRAMLYAVGGSEEPVGLVCRSGAALGVKLCVRIYVRLLLFIYLTEGRAWGQVRFIPDLETDSPMPVCRHLRGRASRWFRTASDSGGFCICPKKHDSLREWPDPDILGWKGGMDHRFRVDVLEQTGAEVMCVCVS